MRDIVSIVRDNVRETYRGADDAERRGRMELARALREEARVLAAQYHIDTSALDGERSKDARRRTWERKKGGKAKFWRDRG